MSDRNCSKHDMPIVPMPLCEACEGEKERALIDALEAALPLLREVAMRSGLSYPDAAGIGMEVADALRKARGDDEQ